MVNFLASLAASGLAYRSVNNFRSAISAGHIQVDGKVNTRLSVDYYKELDSLI